jgi:hypothetical protein
MLYLTLMKISTFFSTYNSMRPALYFRLSCLVNVLYALQNAGIVHAFSTIPSFPMWTRIKNNFHDNSAIDSNLQVVSNY